MCDEVIRSPKYAGFTSECEFTGTVWMFGEPGSKSERKTPTNHLNLFPIYPAPRFCQGKKKS
jgi:hypothetical protein